MHHHHHWSIPELEDLVPFELELYVGMTKNHIEKVKAARNGSQSSYEGPPPEIEKQLIRQKIDEYQRARASANK